jgi:hypothetical protein
MIARFLRVHIWELDTVAVHYQDEAAMILMGRFEAQMKLAKRFKCSPEKIILPDY